MKTFILFFSLTLFCLIESYTQTSRKPDVIIKKDNTKIEAIIQEIDDTTIKYRKITDPQGPLFNLNKKEVVSILYGNGEVENILSVTNPPKNTVLEKPKPSKPVANALDTNKITITKSTSKGWMGYVSGAYAINKYNGFNIHGLIGYKINEWLGFGLGVGYTGFGEVYTSSTVDSPNWERALKYIPGLQNYLLETIQAFDVRRDYANTTQNYTYIPPNLPSGSQFYTSGTAQRYEWAVLANVIIRIPKTNRKSGLYLFGGPGIIYGIDAIRFRSMEGGYIYGFQPITYNYYKGAGLAVELGALYQIGPIGLRFSTQINTLNKYGNHYTGIGGTIMFGKSGNQKKFSALNQSVNQSHYSKLR